MNFSKKLEVLANVAIIVAAALLCTVLVRQHLLNKQKGAALAAASRQVSKGDKLSVPGVDWGVSDRTLLMILSANCRYCTESAPFYRRLAEVKYRQGGLRMLAVLPQETPQGRDYLKGLGVSVDGVLQAPAASSGAKGTPTLLLVNKEGVVQGVWVGKLPPEVETEVLSQLNS